MTDEKIEESASMPPPVTVNRVERSWSLVWIGVGFTLLPSIILLLGYLNVNPQLWRSIPSKSVYEQSAPDVSIAWSDQEKKDPPVEYVRDKFVLTKIETEVPTLESFWSLFLTPLSKVHWSWEYEVKNLTDADREITVNYYLVDVNGIQITESSSKTLTARANETVTLKGEGEIPFGMVSSIYAAGWGIR